MFGKPKDSKEEKKAVSASKEHKEGPTPEKELKAVNFGDMQSDLQSMILSYLPTSQLHTAPPNATVDLVWRERFKLHYPERFIKLVEKNHIEPELDAEFTKIDLVDWKIEFQKDSERIYKDVPIKVAELYIAIKDRDEDAIKQIFSEGTPSEKLEFVGSLQKYKTRIFNLLYSFNEKGVRVLAENQAILDLLYRNICNIYSLVNENALINTSTVDSLGRTILYWAIICSQSPETLASLQAQGSRVDEVYQYEYEGSVTKPYSPIHLASGWGRAELLIVLIGDAKEEKSIVNILDGEGRTPLMWASFNGAINSFPILIGKGADLERLSQDGGSALLYALNSGQDQAAVKLIEAGADFENRLPTGYDPFHLACAKGCLETMKVILGRDGAANGRLERNTNYGSSPLRLAVSYEQTSVVKYLLAQKKVELDKKHFESKDEKTVEQEKRQLFQNMLDSASEGNSTALTLAAKTGNDELVRLLVNAGATIPAKQSSAPPLNPACIDESKLTPATQTLLELKRTEQRTARFLELRQKDPRDFIPTGSYLGGLVTTVRSHKRREIAAAEALSELQIARKGLKAAEATHRIVNQEYKSIGVQRSGGDRGLLHEHELAALRTEKTKELLLANEALQTARLKLKEAVNRVDACKVPIDKSTELDEIRAATKRSLK